MVDGAETPCALCCVAFILIASFAYTYHEEILNGKEASVGVLGLEMVAWFCPNTHAVFIVNAVDDGEVAGGQSTSDVSGHLHLLFLPVINPLALLQLQ